jgi:hypothetical protein
MRLRARTATATSVVRRSSIRERSPSPITRFHRAMAVSILGKRSECLEYCAQHGEARRRVHRVPNVPKDEQGWCWEFGEDGKKAR